MKIKINWGWGMVIAMALFMLFIGSLVYQMMFNEKYNHQLVSENYYKDELLHQLEIDKLDNAAKLTENVSLKAEDGKLFINFPKNMNFSEIAGTINFQYVIEEKFDFEEKIELKNNILIVNPEKLKKGRWNIKIDWKYQNTAYLFKQNINF